MNSDIESYFRYSVPFYLGISTKPVVEMAIKCRQEKEQCQTTSEVECSHDNVANRGNLKIHCTDSILKDRPPQHTSKLKGI